jgi:hypothetical protein
MTTTSEPAAAEPAPIQAVCIMCGRTPDQIDEYVASANAANEIYDLDQCQDCLAMPNERHLTTCRHYTTPERYVWAEEGTLNPKNGHFLCTEDYIKAGMPSSPQGWVAE